MSILLKNQFKPRDIVIITNKHPVYGFCGFADHIKGTRAMIEAAAITEYSEPAWSLRFKHPISQRDVWASMPAACLEPADYDRISFFVFRAHMWIHMHKGDKLRGEADSSSTRVQHPFGDAYPEILACVTGDETGIVQVCGVDIPQGPRQ